MKLLSVLAIVLCGCMSLPPTARPAAQTSTEAVVALVDANGELFCAAVNTPYGVVTARHCVDDKQPGDEVLAAVEFSSNQHRWSQPWYVLRVVRHATDADLSLLSRIPDMRVHQATLSNHAPRRGDTVSCVGHPWGLAFNVTTGHVSSSTPYWDDELGIRLTVTQLPVSPGNSGGPVYNDQHELVGVVTGMHGSLTLITYYADLITLVRR